MSNTTRGNIFLADPSNHDVAKVARNRGIDPASLGSMMSGSLLYSIIKIAKDASSNGVRISSIRQGEPKLHVTDAAFDRFREIQSSLLRVNSDDASDEIHLDFRSQMDAEFLERDMWRVLLYLHQNGKSNIVKICDDLGFPDRDDLREKVITPLQEKRLIRVESSYKRGNVTVRFYSLTERCAKSYFDFDLSPVVKTDEGMATAQKAVEHYRQKGCFVVPARQELDGSDRTDLVGFDYGTGKAISIEVESAKEVSSHHEQVVYNSKKWKRLGFDRCEFWSSSKKVRELVQETENICVFIV